MPLLLAPVNGGGEDKALRAARVWRVLLGVQHTVVEGVEFEMSPEGEVLIARVRPTPHVQEYPLMELKQ